MATRRLEVEFVGDTKSLDKAFKNAQSESSKTSGAFKKVGAVVGGIVAFDTLKNGVGAAIGEFQEARKVGAQTTNVIKSTGGAANVTAKQVADLAGSISKKVGIDDEAIQSGANLLLTFKNVANEAGRGNKVFDRATKAAVDLSAAGFGSMESASKQLGKALNDPVKGITALTRSGVTFTEQQKAKIESLVEEGKTLKAQKIILREVESQVKGSAEAQATALDKAKVAFGNLAEAVGGVLVPMVDKAATFLAEFINQMIEGRNVGGALVSTFKDIGGAAGTLIGWVKGLVGWFKQHETVTMALGAALGVVLTAFVGFKILAAVQAAIIAVRAAMIGLNAAFLANPVVLVVAGIAALAAGLVIAYRESETFRNIVNAVFDALKTGVSAVVDFVTNLEDVPAKAKAAGAAILNAIVEGIKGLPAALVDAAKWLFDTWVTAVKTWIGSYITVGTWLLNRVIDGVKALGGVVASAAKWLFEQLKTGVQGYLNAYKNVGSWVLGRIVDGIKVIASGLGTVGGWLKDTLRAVIEGAAAGFTNIGGWVLGRIVDGIKVIGSGLGTVGGWLKDTLKDLFTNAKDGFMNLGGTVVGWIVDGLKGGLKAIGSFAKLILDVVGAIPGVDTGGAKTAIDKALGLRQGGTYSSAGVQQFASGGAYGRTGGIVKSPITMMGEEAPRYPEFVIPTNPAYRRRAQMLLNKASLAVGVNGYAQGGVIGDMWGWISKGPQSILGALPGTGDIPDWLKGTGKWVLTEVGKYIKDQFAGIFGGGASYGNAGPGAGLTATQRIARMMKASIDIDRKQFPYVYGGGHSPATYDGPYDCSGVVSAVLRAGGLMSGSMTTDGLKTWGNSGDGKNLTVGVRGTTGRSAHTMMELAGRFIESANSLGPTGFRSGWSGVFPIHRNTMGLAEGGAWGMQGPFHDGGIAGATGPAMVSKNEVLFSQSNPPEIHVYIGGEKIDERVEVVLMHRDRRLAGSYWAGAAA
jgi:hypothetical protein